MDELDFAIQRMRDCVAEETCKLFTFGDCMVILDELARLRSLLPPFRVTNAPNVDAAKATRLATEHGELMIAVGDLTMSLPGAAAVVPADPDGFWNAQEAVFAAWAAADRLADRSRQLGDQLMQQHLEMLRTRCTMIRDRAAELSREEVPIA